jgi:hypothetical protein
MIKKTSIHVPEGLAFAENVTMGDITAGYGGVGRQLMTL